ncbi:MAG TPA: hypothetical protein VHQ46_07075 [Desulfobacteria bacterium]|nr:hypothetical protein [Desulfobacteria bacterium]
MEFFFVFGLAALGIEGYPLVKKRQWAEFAAVCILVGSGFVIGLGKQFGLFPTPMEILNDLVHPVGKALFR